MILPVLPLRDSVLFPGLTLPVSVARPSTVAAIQAAAAGEDKAVLVVAQRVSETEEPQPSDLYQIGTRGVIRKAVPSGDGFELILQGIERAAVEKCVAEKGYLRSKAVPRPIAGDSREVVEALRREITDKISRLQLLQGEPNPLLRLVMGIDEPLEQAYILATVLPLELRERQAVLEADTVAQALRLILSALGYEQQILELRHKISGEAVKKLTREQREYVLRQQMREIQDELDEAPEGGELKSVRERLAQAQLPPEVRKELEREIARLGRISSLSPELHVARSYVELVLDLPWAKATEDNLDLGRARAVLDEDHYDLKEVKERVLEHLAVLKLNPAANAPILCFVGPPGTGKTSLGQSIARALGRRFERMSLGGLHDESELRGHRRTYVGAMPGRIIQAVRRAGVRNPLLMLDEVDKIGREFHGDPYAALMEILDPAQNVSFRDNYLDLPFDLSKVLFITTANSLDNIPPPVLDRMEVLRLGGYTEEEKVEIARRYLLPRRLAQAGIRAEQFSLSDAALQRVIRRYTREAGLRQLERSLGSLARKLAVRFAEGRTEPAAVEEQDLAALLGPEPYYADEARRAQKPGVAAALAWTESGGEVLYVETALLTGREPLTMTGHLGEVMKESVQAALSYVLANRERFGSNPLPPKAGIHVHLPSGAVAKDGPSAGLAVAVAIASLLSGAPAPSDTAFTGEITLSGLVLPVGGIKEKLLAARRCGLSRVVLPKANEKDLAEVPELVRTELSLLLVADLDQALRIALPAPLHRVNGRSRPRRHAAH